MNIIEAVKSGKPYKRDSLVGKWFDADNWSLELTLADIIADDWIIESVTINREQFLGAWDVATYKELDPNERLTKIRDKLIDELGL